MKMEDMIMVSVDDHACEPADMWEKHLPVKWKDKAPKLIHQNGADLWVYEGRAMPNIGVNAVAGRVPEEGINNLCWEADYPHSDTTWPDTPERLWESFAGANISDADINKITYQNAMKWFNYDPFKHIPKEQCTVGALRAKAKHVNVDLVSHNRGKPPSDFKKGYATIEDIVMQMAGAMANVKVK
jgi:hypothetical protein